MDQDDANVGPDGTSRRDFIRKSAIVGGAVVWAVPAVQTLGMKAAGAQTISPPDNPPCDTQIAVNRNLGGEWALGANGDFTGNGNCDITPCATLGIASDQAALWDAVQNSGWSTNTTNSAGKQCIHFDLAVLEAYHNAHTQENCSVSALIVKAGSDESTDMVCETQGAPAGSSFTVCRTFIEDNGQTKDVSNVSLCLCCYVAPIPA